MNRKLTPVHVTDLPYTLFAQSKETHIVQGAMGTTPFGHHRTGYGYSHKKLVEWDRQYLLSKSNLSKRIVLAQTQLGPGHITRQAVDRGASLLLLESINNIDGCLENWNLLCFESVDYQGEEFSQFELLTVRITNILQQYPDGSQILKELYKIPMMPKLDVSNLFLIKNISVPHENGTNLEKPENLVSDLTPPITLPIYPVL